jgi:long-subunit fatty acid transport protein
VNAIAQFNFSNPGARSLGFAGAFVGLADDATAAATNPAGLTILSRPEVSVEGRGWSFSHLFSDRGRLYGTPAGFGQDSLNELVRSTSDSSTSGLSFVSFVYPVSRFAFAVYRREVANFEASTRLEGPFGEGLTDTGTTESRTLPVESQMKLKIADIGITGAARLSDKVSVGATLSIYSFSLDSTSTRFAVSSPFVFSNTAVGGWNGAPDYSSNNTGNIQKQVGDETAISVNLGALLRPTEQLSIGVVYRPGPKFDFATSNEAGQQAAFETKTNRAEYNVPDVFAIGMSIRATDRLTISFEYDRIAYSQLAENSIDIFYDPESTSTSAIENREAASKLFANDANELHLGVEYVFPEIQYPIALRGGIWNDPEHRIQFPRPQGQLPPIGEVTESTLFLPGDDELHYALGGGIVFGSRFQIDVAADFSNRINTVGFSAVVRF